MKKIISAILILIMMMSMVACNLVGGINPDNGIDPDDEGFDWIIDDTEDDTTDSNGTNNSPNQGGFGDNQSGGDTGTTTPDLTPDIDPDPHTVTVYLLNRAGWDEVAIYYWSWPAGFEIEGGWPGEELSLGDDGLYRATFSDKFTNLIFNNNNGAQTADLNLPVGDNIVFDNVDNRWITYGEALALLDGDNTDKPTPDSVTVYLINRAGWDEVAVYCWSWADQSESEGGWPGEILSVGEDGLYKVTIDTRFVNIVFNDNSHGSQTVDLTLPDGDRLVYDNLYNFWITYSEAMNILNSEGNDPHEHSYIDGKCECGAEDPNYTPDDPHEHSYVDGKCECGATDPNYVPETPNPEITEEMALFNDLFDPQNHISLKLDISNSELKKIQKDYEKYSSMSSKSPIYRMANLTITITKPDGTKNAYYIDQVGVRMKGNTSRTSFYSDSNGMYNLIHFKISFQETFDDADYYGSDALSWSDSAARKERKNRTFATLEKIDLRWNRNDDTTYIRETYAYDLYREFGVLAPHTNLTSLDIGKDHAGVWVLYEPVDDIFLEKNLPAEALGGDLYKLGWTSDGATFTSFSSYGVEDEDAGKFYVYDLKTNKKTSTHESLKTLINTIKSGNVTKDKFASVVDIQNFMYYCAVSYMVGNCDDLRNNYNNSYIYFRADTGKMIVIPYDMDRGLGVNTWNPTGHGMTKDDPFTKKALGANGDQRSPLFLKSVCTGGFFISEYIQALKEVDASEMLTNAKFSERFEIAKALYSSEATPSKSYNNAGGYKFRFDINRTAGAGESKNMSFADYLKAKRATLYKAIGDQGNTDNSGGSSGGENSGSEPITNSRPYIMGDMNGWAVNEQYAMKSNGDGTFTFTVTSAHVSSSNGRIKFKIFDDNTDIWYGYEIVDPNCTVNYNDSNGNSNGNKNFYLVSGTYVLTFDANTVTLYIEKK